jgi:hypothetical protein
MYNSINMQEHNKRTFAALLIVIAAAFGWMAFGAISFILTTKHLNDLIMGGAVGCALIVGGLISTTHRKIGGVILIFMGLVPVFLFLSASRGDMVITALSAAPPIVSGLLFVLD